MESNCLAVCVGVCQCDRVLGISSSAVFTHMCETRFKKIINECLWIMDLLLRNIWEHWGLRNDWNTWLCIILMLICRQSEIWNDN